MKTCIIEWFDPKEKLPEIPEGRYGVSVLMITFDPVYHDLTNRGYSTTHGIYGHVRDRDGNYKQHFKDYHIEQDFQILFIGSEWNFGPVFEEIKLWAYEPKFEDII